LVRYVHPWDIRDNIKLGRVYGQVRSSFPESKFSISGSVSLPGVVVTLVAVGVGPTMVTFASSLLCAKERDFWPEKGRERDFPKF
jgi:hypothetical protein